MDSMEIDVLVSAFLFVQFYFSRQSEGFRVVKCLPFHERMCVQNSEREVRGYGRHGVVVNGR